MKTLLLIDTMNYVHRAFHALPRTFRDKEGNPVNAVYGVTSMLINVFDSLKPTHVIAAYEKGDREVLRVADFEAYKANRKELDPDIISQLPKVEEILNSFGIHVVASPGYEADDVIGTFAKRAEKEGFDVIIVSNDRDLLQLLSPKVRVYLPDSSKTGGVFFGEREFKEKYGFDPINIIDFKSLRGDASDNIPGVLGIGDKTASSLIQEFHTVDNIYSALESIKPESLRIKLEVGKESAFLSKKIVTIVCDLPLDLKIDDCRLKQVDRLKVVEVLKRYNFKSLIRRLGFEVEEEGKKKPVEEDSAQLKMSI